MLNFLKMQIAVKISEKGTNSGPPAGPLGGRLMVRNLDHVFRCTYPVLVPEAIVFSTSAAVWPTVILSHACQHPRRQKQPIFAQDILVWGGAQDAFHQYR